MKCKYEVDEFCTNDQCPMRGDYCPVPDIDGMCRHEFREEERWELTPKGCLICAIKSHVELADSTIDEIWAEFAELMKKFGYAEDTNEQ